MDVAAEILAERDEGIVRCGVSSVGLTDVLELAAEFDLRRDPRAFEEISASAAYSLVTSILHKDMAYSHPMMTEARAKELAERFLGQFGAESKFFSNGWPGGWNPATDATFDTGVLAIGNARSGCIWVEDED